MIPFQVLRIDHLVFRVADLDRSISFYEQVLGCQVVKQRLDLGLVHVRAGTSMVDLISINGRLGSRGDAAAAAEGRNVDHLCLRVEPFDEAALVAHLARHGVVPQGPASDNFGAEGDGPSLYFHDPDGNTIELKGPAHSPAQKKCPAFSRRGHYLK